MHKPYYIIVSISVSIMLYGCNNGSSNSNTTTNATPTISDKNINMFFIQRLESDPATADLSIQGYNHSLLLGQMLTQIIGSANIATTYVEMPETNLINGYADMGTLQSIEYYTVLNKQDPMVELNYLDPVANAQIINGILTANKPGNYIFGLPYNAINETLDLVSSANGFTFTQLQAGQYGAYILLTKIESNNQITATNYNDGINASTTFPTVDVTTGQACRENFFYQTPESATTTESVNVNSTIYFIRHVEAHDPPWFDNGNYICAGQWRAIAAVQVLPDKIGGLPDFVYAPDPAYENYVRPATSIAPFTINYAMPLNIIPSSQFTYNNYIATANYFFTNPAGPLSGSEDYPRSTLVSWEHLNIEKSVRYLITTIYQQPLPSDFPLWTEPDYDSIWIVNFNSKGQMTFTTSCEGIPSQSLPESCPTFY